MPDVVSKTSFDIFALLLFPPFTFFYYVFSSYKAKGGKSKRATKDFFAYYVLRPAKILKTPLIVKKLSFSFIRYIYMPYSKNLKLIAFCTSNATFRPNKNKKQATTLKTTVLSSVASSALPASFATPVAKEAQQVPAISEAKGKPSKKEVKKVIGKKPNTGVARSAFPFTAIIGQEEMKLALILNVIDPLIGGVMIMGDRGTGKSTTVRALVDLLPEIQVVAGDPFNSDPSDPELMGPDVLALLIAASSSAPGEAKNQEKTQQSFGNPNLQDLFEVIPQKITMVDLPLGATEDRVCGTIDIEKALTEGVKAFEPGLLAKANRGILYVDEVNLLDDHLVDVLLDSAASGWNTVEREGISISHPARFILVGSGNPEEGELRPQLLDRFGMHAQIKTVKDPLQRVKIVEQRAAFDTAPEAFKETYADTAAELSQRIVSARNLLPKVQIDSELRVQISQVCSTLDVDGLRGDIVTNRAAIAIAAFEGRETVAPSDISRVMPLCLRHRLRKDPLQAIDSGDLVNKAFIDVFGENY